MLFNTFEFWIFLIGVLLLVHLLKHEGQNWVLLAASYVFYGAWDWRFLSLMLFSTVVDYYAANYAAPGRSDRTRKLAVWTSMVVNLGLLGFFKYHGFFIDSFLRLLNAPPGWSDSLILQVVLPVGISFYTFQTMSYTLDAYAGRIEPIRSFRDFALYVSFFPQLVAGPIERATNLIPQCIRPRVVDPDKVRGGCYLIVWGLFKKIYVADALANLVNVIYADPLATGAEVYLATVAFAFQIYCDFSGYTDIARGVARLLGFELMLNFDYPYIAKNPSDFWRRWHISLSSWLRDYLYISLGGNRGGRWFTYRNLMITMVLGGLWHGARWNFVLWGVFHGGILAIHRAVAGEGRKKDHADPFWISACKVVGMFQLTLFGWLLFRVESMDQLVRMLSALGSSWSEWGTAAAMIQYMVPVIAPLVLLEAWELRSGKREAVCKTAWPVRAGFVGACIAAALFLNRGWATPFIYFQF